MKQDFSESNTDGDSGETAVIKTAVLKQMERSVLRPRRFPMALTRRRVGSQGHSSSRTFLKPYGACLSSCGGAYRVRAVRYEIRGASLRPRSLDPVDTGSVTGQS